MSFDFGLLCCGGIFSYEAHTQEKPDALMYTFSPLDSHSAPPSHISPHSSTWKSASSMLKTDLISVALGNSGAKCPVPFPDIHSHRGYRIFQTLSRTMIALVLNNPSLAILSNGVPLQLNDFAARLPPLHSLDSDGIT